MGRVDRIACPQRIGHLDEAEATGRCVPRHRPRDVFPGRVRIPSGRVYDRWRRSSPGRPEEGGAVNLYERYVLPRLIDLAMRNQAVKAERARLVPRAAGIVLEVGIGSGLNLPFYGRAVERLYGVDPRRELWALARGRIARVSFPIEFIEASAERVPMGDGSIDTVVTTWTLCSIPEARLALLEMKRLLRPEGQLIFIEHGLAPTRASSRGRSGSIPCGDESPAAATSIATSTA